MFCGLCSLARLTRVTLSAGIVPHDLMTISFIHGQRSSGAWDTQDQRHWHCLAGDGPGVFVAENSSNVGTNARAWLMTRQGRAGDFRATLQNIIRDCGAKTTDHKHWSNKDRQLGGCGSDQILRGQLSFAEEIDICLLKVNKEGEGGE